MSKIITFYILDTSSILSGKQISIKDGKLITTTSVLNELKPGGKDYRKLSYLLENELSVFEPKKSSIEKIVEISKVTGDENRLSKTDIDIVALAIDLKKNSDYNVIILTDDYSIQNISNYLKINFCNISQKPITKRFKWIFKCRGCGKKFSKNIKVCPICGSSIKNIVSKSKKIE